MSKKIFFWLQLAVFMGFAGLVSSQIKLPDPTGGKSFQDLIVTVTNYISGIATSLAAIMFIWAGILYLTSRGDPGQLQKAHKTLLYAAIGTAIALLGTGLVAFIKGILV